MDTNTRAFHGKLDEQKKVEVEEHQVSEGVLGREC